MSSPRLFIRLFLTVALLLAGASAQKSPAANDLQRQRVVKAAQAVSQLPLFRLQRALPLSHFGPFGLDRQLRRSPSSPWERTAEGSSQRDSTLFRRIDTSSHRDAVSAGAGFHTTRGPTVSGELWCESFSRRLLT